MTWVHLHLALNHVPVLGTLFLFLLLLVGWIRKSREIQRLCLWSFVGFGVLSIAIKFTGDFAFDELKGVDWLDKVMIERHEQSADQATTGVFVLGVLGVVGLFLSRGERPVAAWICMALLGAALGTFVLMARTANLGGQLRHPEIRSKVSNDVHQGGRGASGSFQT
ncbi:MAG: hypothetical protein H7X97_03505 [Opitutaceae bacterium]|nr:hypothetical protein [Verrucomicrobiales bacterium]